MGLKAEIDEAIHSHSEWKVYFYNFLHGKLALDAARLGEDHHCTFGLWLESTGHHCLSDADYTEICALHADFHDVVATIVRKIKTKDYSGAHADIAPGGMFNHASELLAQRLLTVSLHFDPKRKSAGAAPVPGAETNKNAGGVRVRD